MRGWLAVFAIVVLALVGLPSRCGAERNAEVEELVRRMTSAYAGVRDYRMRVRSVLREGDGEPEETRLLYWFQRPGRMRLEFLRPHPGLVLVFPDPDGRVRVRLGGLLRFFRISLDPGSARLQVSPGQRVDQTDLGQLVANVARSLTAEDSGGVALSREGDRVVAAVESENHFLPGVRTRYQFWVDRQLWLPVRLREEVPSRGWVRDIRFEDLELNPGLPESLFRSD